MANPDTAEQLSEAMLAPIREVGMLLAQAIDDINDRLDKLEQQLEDLRRLNRILGQ